MMKNILQAIILLTLFQSCRGQSDKSVLHKPNYIDSIKTAKQLTNLILKIDNRYRDFKINESLTFKNRYSDKNYKKISDNLKIKPWTKSDFDSNGLNDILIIGTWSSDHYIICILDKGQNQYEIKPITRRSFQECTFPVVTNNKIKYYFESYSEEGNWDKPRKFEHITLTYKFGDFIEENLLPSKHKIERLEYSTTGCYGTCPIFSLKIDSTRNTTWNAEDYNKIGNIEVTGNLTTRITEKKYNELVMLLNYLSFEKLKDKYAVTWTDDQSSTLKITYDNGKTKSITDYGLIGTFGLDRAYKLLFELRENQNWTQ